MMGCPLSDMTTLAVLICLSESPWRISPSAVCELEQLIYFISDRFAVLLLTFSRAIGCNHHPPVLRQHLQWFMTKYGTAWIRTKNVSALGFSAADLYSTANTETEGNRREKRFPLGPSTATNVIGFDSQWRKIQLKSFKKSVMQKSGRGSLRVQDEQCHYTRIINLVGHSSDVARRPQTTAVVWSGRNELSEFWKLEN